MDMNPVNYLRNTLQRFRKDERGNIAMIFGVVFLVLIACIGSGYDMNQLVSTKQKASSIADTAVLTAAVYYSEHGEAPSSLSEGLMHNHEYDASDLNYSFTGLSNKMAQNVKIKVTYDDVNKEATAEVYGHTDVAFMQIFGHNKLDFKTTSVAKFSEVQIKDPASLMFVLDNSGSMEFDDLAYKGYSTSDSENPYPLNARPPGAVKRLGALESAVRDMMVNLRPLVSGDSSDPNGRSQRIIRTAMIPYSSNVLTGYDVPGQWGLLSNSQINAMNYQTGTNSAPPLDDAMDVMGAYTANDPENEAKIHFDEHGNDPLRYVIFMTDGQNNGSFDIWTPRSGTDTWRRWREAGDEDYSCTKWWHVKKKKGGHWHYDEDSNGSDTCTREVDAGWEYEHNSPVEPAGNGWQEGVFDNQSNLDSRSTCADMHASGVEVFTIAFGLVPGWFYTNNWGSGIDDYPASAPLWRPDQYPISDQATDRAKELMRYCASTPQNYTDAADSAALTAAFEKIGEQIVKELIRLKS